MAHKLQIRHRSNYSASMSPAFKVISLEIKAMGAPLHTDKRDGFICFTGYLLNTRGHEPHAEHV